MARAPGPPPGFGGAPPKGGRESRAGFAGAVEGARPRADKRLGQHFLLDRNLNAKIARLAGPLEGVSVLEIGPGPGGLTRALLEAGAARVAAVEKDRRFLPGLEAIAAEFPERLRVEIGNALAIDERALLAPPYLIAANLPYNIASPLIAKWLTGPLRPISLTLMFQKEVAQRLTARPGTADYGRLSVLAQALCKARIVLDIPARAFTPPPKVASALVRLDPLPNRPSEALIAALQEVARAAFGQRRKMLRSSLKGVGGEALARTAGFDPTRRAETLSISEFLTLARVRLEAQSR